MNSKILQIFLYELRRNLRRKGFLFATFGIPIIGFILLFGYQAITDLNADQEAAPVAEFDFEGIKVAGYVDQAGIFSEAGEANNETIIPYVDAEAAQASLDAGEIDVFYIIHEDYLETGNVTLHLPELSISKLNSTPVEQLFYSTFARDLPPEILTRLRFPAQIEQFNLQRNLPDGAAQNEDADFALVYVFAIIFLLGIFLTNGYLMQSVIEEKESQLIEILVATVRPTQLLLGKVLALGLMGMLQILSWGISLLILITLAKESSALANTFISAINVPTDMLPVMLVYFVLGYLFFSAAYGMVGAISGSMREGPQYAAIFTIPSVIPFYFFTIFAETPDATAPVILSMFPMTSPLAMMMRMSVTPVPIEQILLSLSILVLSVVGMAWLAGRVFRFQTLLSGQTPRLRDLPKLVRG